jgi:hypothetical protein
LADPAFFLPLNLLYLFESPMIFSRTILAFVRPFDGAVASGVRLSFPLLVLAAGTVTFAQTPFPKRIGLPSQHGKLWKSNTAVFGIPDLPQGGYWLNANKVEAVYGTNGGTLYSRKYNHGDDILLTPTANEDVYLALQTTPQASDLSFGLFSKITAAPIFRGKIDLPLTRAWISLAPNQQRLFLALDRNETIEVIALDGNGATVWAKRLASSRFGVPSRDGSLNLQAATITADFDGTSLVWITKNLSTIVPFSTQTDTFLIKLSALGAVLWAREFSGSLSPTYYNEFGDGSFLVSDTSRESMARIDSNGNVVWAKKISGASTYAFSTANGKIFLGGFGSLPGNFSDTYIARLSSAGALETQTAFRFEGTSFLGPRYLVGGAIWFSSTLSATTPEKPVIGWIDTDLTSIQARRYDKPVNSAYLLPDGQLREVMASFFSEQDQAVDVIPFNRDFAITAACDLFTAVTPTPIAPAITVADTTLELKPLQVTASDFTPSFGAASHGFTVEPITLLESSICTPNTETPLAPPTIIASPADLRVTVGGFALLFATHPDFLLPNPTWQWKFNGQAIHGATNSNLSLSNVTKAQAGVYTVVFSSGGKSSEASVTLTVVDTFAFSVQPAPQSVAAGGSATMTATAADSTFPGTPAYQWLFNGVAVAGATSTSLTVPSVGPANVGAYVLSATLNGKTITSNPAVLVLNTTARATGTVTLFAADITHPATGFKYDQFLLTGSAGTITAADRIARTSYLDLTDDIVQVEFSGPGVLTITLAGASGPATPVKYNQPTVQYMRGHATITLTGATENTHLSVFSVGTLVNGNPALYKPGETYDGVADIALINISSPTNRFGGVRLANAEFSASAGNTGLHAPGVRSSGPVNIHNVSASGTATPFLLTGAIDAPPRIGITGGDMFQPNNKVIQIGDAPRITMLAGATSHNVGQAAKTNLGVYERDGVNVTTTVIQNP